MLPHMVSGSQNNAHPDRSMYFTYYKMLIHTVWICPHPGGPVATYCSQRYMYLIFQGFTLKIFLASYMDWMLPILTGLAIFFANLVA